MKRLLLVSVLLFTGCATINPGHEAVLRSSGEDGRELHVTAKLNPDYSDSVHMYLDVTYKNDSRNWIRISDVKVEPNDGMEANNLRPLEGGDLSAWAQSAELKKNTARQNMDNGFRLAAIGGAAGALAGALTNNKALEWAGLGVTAGAAVGGLAVKSMRSKKDTETANQNPDNYLLNSYSIPADGYARKWLVLYVADQSIASSFLLKLETADGEKMIYEVPIQR